MIGYFRAYRLGLFTTAACLVMLVAGATRTLLVPVGSRLDYAIPLGLVVPALAALVVAFGTRSAADFLALQGVRPVRRLLLVRLGAGVILPSVVGAVVAGVAFGQWGYGAVVARNYLLVLGLALVALRITGTAWFWFPTSVYVIACLVVGIAPSGHPRAWALLSHLTATLATVVPCGVVLVAGCVAALTRPRHRAF